MTFRLMQPKLRVLKGIEPVSDVDIIFSQRAGIDEPHRGREVVRLR